MANATMPADFQDDNLMIADIVTDPAPRSGVGKIMLLSYSFIYPKEAPRPIPRSTLLTNPLLTTHDWNAAFKIAGIKLARLACNVAGLKGEIRTDQAKPNSTMRKLMSDERPKPMECPSSNEYLLRVKTAYNHSSKRGIWQ